MGKIIIALSGFTYNHYRMIPETHFILLAGKYDLMGMPILATQIRQNLHAELIS